jgi:hypothetical protein
MTTVIVGRAWKRFSANTSIIKQAFLQYGIFIYPDGHKDHLINIKEVDNSSLDFNGWRG